MLKPTQEHMEETVRILASTPGCFGLAVRVSSVAKQQD